MSCTSCHRDIAAVAKGLCRACYQRLQKRGTTEYAEKRARTFCHIDNCGKPVVSHGMCDTHRKRFSRHGHAEQTRSDDWGSKRPSVREKHPLFNSWAYLRKYRGKHPVEHVWLEDFLQFVADVGCRPTPKHKLFSADETKPIGPKNFIWKRSFTEMAPGEDRKTYENRCARARRALSPDRYKGYELKRSFGMSEEQYKLIHDRQDGKCGICRKPETHEIHGKRIKLAVDHCHTGGQVRALLCAKCNTGLGSFRDDPELLRAAAAYLEKHTLPLSPE